MRISSIETDSGYIEDAYQWTVYVDLVPCIDVVTADDNGYVKQLIVDSHGTPTVECGELLYTEYMAMVEINKEDKSVFINGKQ